MYMDELLHAGRRVYDKHSPPIQEAERPTIVRLAMYIEGMSSFRTQTMDFQLDVYFQQFWKDPRLAHNETRRVLIRDKEVLSKMWHPDVYFANARIAEFHQVTQPNFLLWIEPDGSILYDTRISMVVVYAYTTDQLQIEWIEETPITRNPNIAMSDMHIVDLFPGLCDGNYSTGTWSCVTAEFFVKREVTHHVMQSYVPTTLIVVISWFSFWLDVDAVPARVSLAITTLLTLSTQANAARMALPEVSYMKAIDVWMGACMM
ncbi:Glutamate-gated chloride channel [Trichostrongylus colubriformis]|uniref:Glutamate-gated chloride channel n=1 Tax=Trichostrongylus colubriformis TaxID=6319 RepID=A0AAN8FDB8_TRICO